MGMLIKYFSYSFATFSLILTFFIHCEFFWIHNASRKIHKSTDQNNLNNLNSLSTTQKKSSKTNRAQQKQRKQLILTDSKNIFTYSFQPIQRLQPNFVTDGFRNFKVQ